jgi:hypothetical protein
MFVFLELFQNRARRRDAYAPGPVLKQLLNSVYRDVAKKQHPAVVGTSGQASRLLFLNPKN